MADLGLQPNTAWDTSSGIEVAAIANPRRREVCVGVNTDGVDQRCGHGNALVFLSPDDARRLGHDLLRAARQVENGGSDGR